MRPRGSTRNFLTVLRHFWHSFSTRKTFCQLQGSADTPSARAYSFNLKNLSLHNITPCFLSYVQYHTRHAWHVKYHTYCFILVFLMNLPKFSFWWFFLFSPHESTACRISHPGHPTLLTHTSVIRHCLSYLLRTPSNHWTLLFRHHAKGSQN